MIPQKLHKPCWDGWWWKGITKEHIPTFSSLYLPSACGMASDFWHVAPKTGALDVAILNTSYQIMWIALIIVNAVAGATGIKMTMQMGDMDYNGAKQAAKVGILLITIVSILHFEVSTSLPHCCFSSERWDS
jgi:Na+-driven multidrug efflux pump